jgi:2'-5' RNA ligase
VRLFAALLLPREVLDHVTQLAAGERAEQEPEAAAEPAQPGRHLAGSSRLFGRRRDQVQDTAPANSTGPLLDLVPQVRMHVPIVKFGNLSLTDAARLVDTMERQAAGWQSPRLHLHGGVALEPEGDNSVWVKLDGDLDELNAVVRDVARVAQGLHLFVDRRAWRTHLKLGTINERTTEAYLEQLLSELEAFESQSWWQTTMSMLIPIDLGPEKAPFRLHRDIQLGPAVPH